jgi:hypothetical protein
VAVPVVTQASGGLPVVDVTATAPKLGVPVSEAANGIAVTKVSAVIGGLPVTYVTAPLLARGEEDERSRTDRSGTRKVAGETRAASPRAE